MTINNGTNIRWQLNRKRKRDKKIDRIKSFSSKKKMGNQIATIHYSYNHWIKDLYFPTNCELKTEPFTPKQVQQSQNRAKLNSQ